MYRFKWFLVASVIVSVPAMVRAVGGGVSYSNTNGSHGFDSNTVDGNLDLTSGYYLGASYNSYHSDNSSGTINTYYGRLGRYTPNGAWKLFGSVTPEVSAYKEVSAGGDFRTTILGRSSEENEMPLPAVDGGYSPAPSAPPSWHANPRLDFTGGYAREMYTDQGQKINENDITGGLGFNLFKTYLSGSFTKSLYDEEFNGTFNTNTRRFNVGYAGTILPGYPDYAYTASVDQSLLPGWWLMGSYTHLKYKAGPDDLADLISAGTGVTLFHVVILNVMYTRYIPKGSDKQNYLSLGAGLQF